MISSAAAAKAISREVLPESSDAIISIVGRLFSCVPDCPIQATQLCK
jgi:hypothetical protein